MGYRSVAEEELRTWREEGDRVSHKNSAKPYSLAQVYLVGASQDHLSRTEQPISTFYPLATVIGSAMSM